MFLAYENVTWRTIIRVKMCSIILLSNSFRCLSFVQFNLQGRHEKPKYFLTPVSINSSFLGEGFVGFFYLFVFKYMSLY